MSTTPIRTVTFTVSALGVVTPSTPQSAGVQGDHNATLLVFSLPASLIVAGYLYRIEYVDGMGGYGTTDLLTLSSSTISTLIPRAWTQNGGSGNVHLKVTKLDSEGVEEQIIYTSAGHIAFKSREDGTDALQETFQQGVDGMLSVTRSASTAAIAAADVATAHYDLLNLKYQEPVSSFSDISTTYPTPELGWATRVTGADTDGIQGKAYRYNGTTWEFIDIISPTFYDAMLTAFNLKLEEKPTKGEIKSTDFDLSSDEKKLQLVNLSDEVKQAMAGTTSINASVANIAVVKEKIAPKAVTEDKTSFLQVASNNFIDMNTALSGYALNSSGAVVVNASTRVLGFTPVKANTVYSIIYCHVIAYYKADYSFISYASITGYTAASTITTPADCAYVKMTNYLTSNYPQLNEGSTLLQYDLYKLQLTENVEIPIPDEISTIENLTFGSDVTMPYDLSTDLKVNATVTKSNQDYNFTRTASTYAWFAKPNTNRFKFTLNANTNAFVCLNANGTESIAISVKPTNVGRVVKVSTTALSIVVSEFSPQTPYTATTSDQILIEYKNYIVTASIKKVGETAFTSYFTRDLSAYKTTIDSVSGECLGLMITSSSGSASNLETNILGTIEEKTDTAYVMALNASADTYYKNIKWSIGGDSVSANNGGAYGENYPTLIQKQLGIGYVDNNGIGGTRIARKDGAYQDANSLSAIYTTYDADAGIITIFAGTNDYQGGNISGVPLGAKGSTNDHEFYGALKILIEGLIGRYPKGRIGFITPLRRNSDTVANLEGHTLKNYVDAIIDMCGDYGIPVLDLYRKGGINSLNSSTVTTDGLHPNTDGNILISRKIADFIKSL